MDTVADTIIHVPHSATPVPADMRGCLLLSEKALADEIRRMTDWYTDELFKICDPGTTTLRFPVSRLVVDPERFLDDAQEPMAQVGMGVIYTRTSDGNRLREDPSPFERRTLLDRYYVPHHQELSKRVDAALRAHGHALLLDGHSFPSESLPCHHYHGRTTPDVCVGTDEFHTPSWLRDLAVGILEGAGFEVAVDWPFSGAIVPLDHHRRTPTVLALMIELNRRCYMDERDGSKLARFREVAQAVAGAVDTLVRGVRSRCGAR